MLRWQQHTGSAVLISSPPFTTDAAQRGIRRGITQPALCFCSDMIMYVTVPSCLRSDGNPYITYHFGLLDGLCSYLVYYRVSDLKMVFFK